MKLNIEDFRQALDLIGEAGRAEAAIVAQFALDLAVTARSSAAGIAPQEAHRLLCCGSLDTARYSIHSAAAAVRSVGMDRDGTPSFFYAAASFSSPELSDILCRTTVISHVCSRGCCSALRPHGLSLA
jgi:hypothetical protein